MSVKSKVLINDELLDDDADDFEKEDCDDNDDDDDDKEIKDNDEEESSDSEDINSDHGNIAWADAMSKVLHFKGSKKKVILLKAKKDRDVKKKQIPDNDDHIIEFVDKEGNVKKVNDETKNQMKKNKITVDDSRPKKRMKTQWEQISRLKPDVNEKERERMFTSIATKGVVQLFNAVKEQQRTIESELKHAGPSETKRDRALSRFTKEEFIDKLKTSKTKKEKSTPKPKQKWNVLRDDFMIGAKMKDWDRDSESGDELLE